ncbi:CBS domain-containing protein [Desulfovibrio mangrovi]|uniref:CBS domain-containing protein n=1 Tax=Desulfovibrio mangrovi TaxID=2976983 RepID=UPI0022455100|nr:CBS domain-containing protein [Desulfovibrio mangrovi]UZP66056.1 CBS domain-containing protein [Desulfovibrio mangrovi]
MYVGLKMLKSFMPQSPDTLAEKAAELMETNMLWMLLIVQDDKVIGYVRKEDISAAMPSKMTGLDKHEINYLLSKLTLRKIMRTDITTVRPETEIETAAVIMREKNVAGLAVVDANDKVIGFINRTVLLDVLAEEMGYGTTGSRIVFEVEDRPGVLKHVSTLIDEMGYSIIAAGTFNHGPRRMVVIRIDAENPSSVAAALQKNGYDVVGPEDFRHEWE